MTTDKVDCLGMGIMPLDLLYTVPHLPRAGGKVDAVASCIQGGGPVPNALVGLSRLGMRTALIGAVGDDHAGRLALEHLVRDRVDASHVIVKKRASAVAVGFIEEGSGRRTIALYRRIRLGPADLKLSRLPRPRVIHLDGRDLGATIRLAKWGRRIGATVTFDIGSVRNDVSPVLPLIDHLVVADAFAFPFTGARTAAGAIGRLETQCRGTIVITEGTKGATGREQGTTRYQPAYRVRCVDTTGAGDSFHAGYLYGLLMGWDLSRRLQFGAATAALKCTRLGARSGAPRLRQVRRFLSSHPEEYV